MCNKNVITPIIGTALAQLGSSAPALREMARKQPAKDSSAAAKDALLQAAAKRMTDLGITSPESRNLNIKENVPKSTIDALQNSLDYGAYLTHYAKDDGRHIAGTVQVNPNAARDILAHELGHHVTAHTRGGDLINTLRTNPKLAMALSGGVLGLPFLQGALQEGDDDIASGIAIAGLAGAPTLINEALATKNGLAILEEAGMKATAGQRGRLAGALLGYSAVPVLAGLAGTGVGNFVDDYTAVYDL